MRVRIPPKKIEEWVSKHFDYKPRADGTELLIANPFHDNDKRKFCISTVKGICHDWRSDAWAGPVNASGKRNCSFINFVKLYLKCSHKEALLSVLGTTSNLRSYLEPDAAEEEEKPKEIVRVALPDGVLPLANSTTKQSSMICRWLESRGYTRSLIEQHKLSYIGMEVFWPYYEYDELVYWQSRSRLNKRFRFPSTNITDDSGKVIAITEGSKGDYLYGFDEIDAASYLIITESIFSKVVLGAQTVASGGAALTSTQLTKIRLLGPRRGIILSPDNDKAGIESIIANHGHLFGLGFPLYYSLPPPMKEDDWNDWNDMFRHEHKTSDEIRACHDSRIRSLTTIELVKLRKMAQLYSKK